MPYVYESMCHAAITMLEHAVEHTKSARSRELHLNTHTHTGTSTTSMYVQEQALVHTPSTLDAIPAPQCLRHP